MDTVQIPIERGVFEKLQSLAVPLIDDANTVIERLIAHWETNPPGATTPSETLPRRYWKSSRGNKFEIGAQLRCAYHGKTYHAEITEKGIAFGDSIYANPSTAGVAVKHSAGTHGRAAATNGWEFWEIRRPGEQNWLPLNTLRDRSAE